MATFRTFLSEAKAGFRRRNPDMDPALFCDEFQKMACNLKKVNRWDEAELLEYEWEDALELMADLFVSGQLHPLTQNSERSEVVRSTRLPPARKATAIEKVVVPAPEPEMASGQYRRHGKRVHLTARLDEELVQRAKASGNLSEVLELALRSWFSGPGKRI